MTISFCVVAYNEEEYLPSLLQDICSQTWPHELLEVVLVDSGSSDNTKGLMEEFSCAHAGEFFDIQVLDNPGKCQAAGWNVAFTHFKGDILARIDAHTKIPADFIAKNAALLMEGEMVTGGSRPCLIREENAWSRLLLDAETSMFGSSIAPYRRKAGKQYVNSMFHACYRREVIETVGLMNEHLGRTEDNEYHYRVRQAGYRLRFDPDIISYQYARPTLRKMCQQKFGNGYWIALTYRVCPDCLSCYHFVPFAFVLAICGSSGLAALGKKWPAKLLWGLYGSLCGLMSLPAIFSMHDKKTGRIRPEGFLLPFLFLALHLSYGLGTVRGFCDKEGPGFREDLEEL